MQISGALFIVIAKRLRGYEPESPASIRALTACPS